MPNPKRDRLNGQQRRLTRSLDELMTLLGLNYRDALAWEPAARTPILKNIRDQLIRSEVVMNYTLVDEHLNSELRRYFFGRGWTWRRMWRTKKFRNFHHHFLEELGLLKKLAFVKSFRQLPRGIVEDIERLNALRNGLAHALFPQTLKRSRPVWKGKHIYSLDGIKQFVEDMADLHSFLVAV